jgi:hypothetical protein
LRQSLPDCVAGRRGGKTYLALIEQVRAAWGPGRLAWYIGPTNKQTKRIAFTGPSRPNETDLSIELVAGGTIALL